MWDLFRVARIGDPDLVVRRPSADVPRFSYSQVDKSSSVAPLSNGSTTRCTPFFSLHPRELVQTHYLILDEGYLGCDGAVARVE